MSSGELREGYNALETQTRLSQGTQGLKYLSHNIKLVEFHCGWGNKKED